jgi:hypothetical protein
VERVDEETRQTIEAMAARVRVLTAELEEVRRDLRAALFEAREDGATVSGLARAVGVTRQRMQQLLKPEEAPDEDGPPPREQV